MREFLQALLGQSEWNSFRGHWLPVGFKVVISIFCGGLVGLERELKHKPSGLRTNILICLGASLYTTLSVMVSTSTSGAQIGDPARIAAQVVSGVGFLCGGIILQSRGSISGLTSAASAWVVSAIGVCIGLGYPITALIFTFTVVFTLYILGHIDSQYLGKFSKYKVCVHLKDVDPQSRANVMNAFQNTDLELGHLSFDEGDKRFQIHAAYFASDARHLQVQVALWSVAAVDKIDVNIT